VPPAPPVAEGLSLHAAAAVRSKERRIKSSGFRMVLVA